MSDRVTSSQGLLAGRYEVDELLWSGGTGDVRAGTDVRSGAQVMIQFFKPLLSENIHFSTKFLRVTHEAQALDHPNILRLRDSGEEMVIDESGIGVRQLFLVTEFPQGRRLSEIGRRLSMPEIRSTLDALLRALEYASAQGVLHRGISPGQVFLSETGTVQLMNFGVVGAAYDSMQSWEASVIFGTTHFLSPEEVRNEHVDVRSDLYSVGVVLYALLTGRPPFVGDSPRTITFRHMGETPAIPSTLNPSISPAFDRLLGVALGKSRAERFQSVQDFQASLTAAFESGESLQGSNQDPELNRVSPADPPVDLSILRGDGFLSRSSGGSGGTLPEEFAASQSYASEVRELVLRLGELDVSLLLSLSVDEVLALSHGLRDPKPHLERIVAARQLLELVGEHWGDASADWLTGPNALLGGARPIDVCVLNGPDAVVLALSASRV